MSLCERACRHMTVHVFSRQWESGLRRCVCIQVDVHIGTQVYTAGRDYRYTCICTGCSLKMEVHMSCYGLPPNTCTLYIRVSTYL